MKVYFITLFTVCILCYLAEEMDWPMSDELEKIKIIHSSDTQIVYFVVICILVLVAGLRYNVGADYGVYYHGYTDYIDNLHESLKSLDEPGYGVLAWIATRFINDGAAAIFIASLVTISLPLIVIYRYSDKLLLPVFLYITIGCWSGSFNGVRQYLAASILLCGYKALRERNIFKYCLIVFLAFLFHRSAIVALLLYFVTKRKITPYNIVLLIAIASIALISYEQVLSIAGFVMEKEYSMGNAYTSTAVNRLRILAACAPAVVFVYAYYDKAKSEAVTFALNITIIRATIAVLAMNSALLYRIEIYTSLFAPLAISELMEGISEKNRKTLKWIMAILYIVMWWYEIYKTGSLNHFQWIWERH